MNATMQHLEMKLLADGYSLQSRRNPDVKDVIRLACSVPRGSRVYRRDNEMGPEFMILRPLVDIEERIWNEQQGQDIAAVLRHEQQYPDGCSEICYASYKRHQSRN